MGLYRAIRAPDCTEAAPGKMRGWPTGPVAFGQRPATQGVGQSGRVHEKKAPTACAAGARPVLSNVEGGIAEEESAIGTGYWQALTPASSRSS